MLKGKKLSQGQIWYGNVCLAQTDLYAMSEVRTVSAEKVEPTAQQNGRTGKDILLVVAVVAAGIISVFVVIRIVGLLRIAVIRRKSRRYRKSRRRSR